jgi:hypothetical protein
LYIHVIDSIVLIPFLNLRVYALVLFFYYCLIFIYAFISCSIAWFPSIVPVGFSSGCGPPPYNSRIRDPSTFCLPEALKYGARDTLIWWSKAKQRRRGRRGEVSYIYIVYTMWQSHMMVSMRPHSSVTARTVTSKPLKNVKKRRKSRKWRLQKKSKRIQIVLYKW